MFIGIFSKASIVDDKPFEEAEGMRYFDASTIVCVADNASGGAVFAVARPDGTIWHHTPSYDAGGLIELIMQARLRPAEFLPSLYVGKKPKPDDNGNSVAWSAKDNA